MSSMRIAVAAQTTASVHRWTEVMYVLSKSSRVRISRTPGRHLLFPGYRPVGVAGPWREVALGFLRGRGGCGARTGVRSADGGAPGTEARRQPARTPGAPSL